MGIDDRWHSNSARQSLTFVARYATMDWRSLWKMLCCCHVIASVTYGKNWCRLNPKTVGIYACVLCVFYFTITARDVLNSRHKWINKITAMLKYQPWRLYSIFWQEHVTILFPDCNIEVYYWNPLRFDLNPLNFTSIVFTTNRHIACFSHLY